MQLDLEQINAQASKIFTQDNLPAIVWFLNKCKTIPHSFAGDNEFQTIVNAAKFDSQEEYIKKIIATIQS